LEFDFPAASVWPKRAVYYSLKEEYDIPIVISKWGIFLGNPYVKRGVENKYDVFYKFSIKFRGCFLKTLIFVQ